MATIIYEVEFAKLDGDLKFLVVAKDEHCVKELDLAEIGDYVNNKYLAQELVSDILFRQKDWHYPTDFHPDEGLDRLGGRENFRQLDDDFFRRMSNVAERIMHFLIKNIRFIGEHDIELITDYAISTYFPEIYEYAPRLLVKGSTVSGKSRLLKVLKELCYRANGSSDTTESCLFRMIDQYHTTPILDEYQDYKVEVKDAIKVILKNGIERGMNVQRNEKHGDRQVPTTFEIFAPVVFDYQAGFMELPEELINRSISIVMVRTNDPTIPNKLDKAELEEIRNELYTLRLMWRADPKLYDIEGRYNEALEELQSPDGVECCGHRYLFNTRCRDIVGTMYPISKMIGTEDATLRFFSEMQRSIEDDEKGSSLGKVFSSMMDVLEQKEEIGLFKGKEYELLNKVTTFEVAREYEVQCALDGDIGPNTRVSTRAVTNMLKDMGFKFERGSQNKSVFSLKGLKAVFLGNLSRYGSREQLDAYCGKVNSKRKESVNPVVNGKSQDGAEVNKVSPEEP